MAKYSGPLQEVARALDLVPYLSTHSYISITELAQEFDVTEREMISELTALSMCGLPGYTAYELIDISFDSGYVTIRNHEPLNITRALSKMELTSLLIGLELLRGSINTPSDSINEKIEILLAKLKALIDIPLSADPVPYSQETALIEKAISQGKFIEFTYISTARDEASHRTVSPDVIRVELPHVYIDGYCNESLGHRSFRLDRISSLTISEFETAQIAESSEEARGSFQAKIKFHARLRRHSENLGLAHNAGSELISIEAFSQSWIERALLAAAPDIEVIEPIDLRENIHAKAREILALYPAQ